MTTLYTNARLHGAPATAMAVEAGRITWLGHDHPGPVADTVDLGGAFVAPAFVDAHVHATGSGLMRTGLDLTAAESLADVLDAVRDRARDGDTLLWGHGWDETRWPERRPPTRAELDAVAGGVPVYLSRVDVHSAAVTTALVELAPEARTAPGWSALGPLARDAHHHVRHAVDASITPAQRDAAQLAFLRHAASEGIACVHECGGPDISGADDFAALLARSGALPRVVGYWGAVGPVPPGARGLAGDLFVDGALGSRTAALHEPYTDRPDTRGARYLDAAAIAAHVVACTEAGVQAGFHVIGDAAVTDVVAGFRLAAGTVGADALRAATHRLEHLEMVTAEQAGALAGFGVVASVQPLFDAAWGGRDGMYAERLGPDRGVALNPFATLLAEGVTMAFGSDTPVTRVDPWASVAAAVAHRTPSSRIGEDAAFAAHTRGGWAAAGETGGVLEVGAAATFAVWRDHTCLRTVLDGTTIYEGKQ